MTCRHYRFQVPREDADEFRATDAAPCPLCDERQHGKFQMIIWSPVMVSSTPRHFFQHLRQRVSHWFKPETHDLPAPVSRPC